MINFARFKFLVITLILLLLPSLLTITALSLRNSRGPYWLCSNLDPEYQYLFNFLNLSRFKSVGNYEHPGATVQFLGAITLRFVYHTDTSSNDNLQTDVLKRPEHYLRATNNIMILLNSLLLLIVGVIAYKYTGNIWLATLLQLSPFLSTTILEYGLMRVSPEPLLLFSSLLFALIVPIMINRESKHNYRHYMMFFAIASGFGLATKMTFIPMIIIPLLMLPTLRIKMFYLLGTVLSFICFTPQLIPKYKEIFKYLFGILTHTGYYGFGKTGLIDPDIYTSNIWTLLNDHREFSIILLISVCIIIMNIIVPSMRKTALDNTSFRLLFALTTAQMMALLMIAKHPNSRYLLPELALLGSNLFIIGNYFMQIKGKISINLKRLTILIALILAVIVVLNTGIQHVNLFHETEMMKKDSLEIYQKVQNDYKDHTKVYFFSASSPLYALGFGHGFIGRIYSAELEEIYNRVYFYNIWGKWFHTWKGMIPEREIADKYDNGIVFQGSVILPTYLEEQLEPVSKGICKMLGVRGEETLYIMKPRDKKKEMLNFEDHVLDVDLFELKGNYLRSDDGFLLFPWGGTLSSRKIGFKKSRYEIRITSKGTEVQGENAHFKVYIGEDLIGEYFAATDYKETVLSYESINETHMGQLSVEFSNDFVDPVTKSDRNAWIKSIIIRQVPDI